MRRILTPLVLSCLLGGPALGQQAQDPPTLWSFYTVERFSNAVFYQIVMSARAFADIRYQSV